MTNTPATTNFTCSPFSHSSSSSSSFSYSSSSFSSSSSSHPLFPRACCFSRVQPSQQTWPALGWAGFTCYWLALATAAAPSTPGSGG
ncbi:hypothetical protein PoB_007033900 [Plakobranchus ocellatus]|uniref:Uncharacterized protein n=1 Tax=Plakobranchus ocellatus TaxID=259542 RepID=A0AAV4DHX3_9GAST|nr:hypothetical protein PoB_007033900 [Plakobranchus ocellatus]